MEQIFQFVVNHSSLWLLFIAILGMIVYLETHGLGLGVKLITTGQLTEFLNRQRGVVIDLRDDAAYRAGHINGALHIPLEDWDAKQKNLSKYRAQPVILVCAEGSQAKRIGTKLKADNFTQVFALSGGIKHWLQEELPLETKSSK
jgi:rhodanese-related sulfurtransferase